MSAVPWFEDDNPRDLVRWSAAAFAVVCLHAAVIAAYLFMWRAPNVEIGDETAVISIELTAPQIDQVEQPQVYVDVLKTLPNGYVFANKADIGGKYQGEWVIGNTTWATTVYAKPVKLPKTGY